MRIPERIMDYVKKENFKDAQELKDNVIDENKNFSEHLQLDEALKPVVFVTHMEHHSNQLTWLETIATVEIIKCGDNGNVDLEHFTSLLEQFKHRKNKIAAVTACSNVTGIQTPYYEIAKIIHEYGGLCFVDFACSAPYIDINMHPAAHGRHLDAIYFSPHKFLGGPGTPGVPCRQGCGLPRPGDADGQADPRPSQVALRAHGRDGRRAGGRRPGSAIRERPAGLEHPLLPGRAVVGRLHRHHGGLR